MGSAWAYRFSKPFIARMRPEMGFTRERIDSIANPIANFSPAGIRAVAQEETKGAQRLREPRATSEVNGSSK